MNNTNTYTREIFSVFNRLGVCIVMVCALIIATHTPAHAYKEKYASIVMDADTGMILHQRHADEKLHPASLTKIMTLLLAFEAIQSGQMSLKDRIRISSHAANMVPSKLGLPAGASIKVQDAIYALVTKSANDVAVALAEHIGGSEQGFAQLMTRRARQIGMNNTNFTNASGLHDPRQISSARDMAKLARTIIINYPSYYRYFSTANFTYNGKTYRNHNKLLGNYPGMDGMKTGYINASGFNLVASAVRDNRRIIGVVFGGRTSQSRNDHMVSLLDQGFQKIGRVRVAHQIPVPNRKPGANNDGYVLASAMNAQTLDEPGFAEHIGQGDIDPSATRRLQTGLLAVAAHKRQYQDTPNVMTTSYAVAPAQASPIHSWSIQVGAYESRARSDQMVTMARQKLPQHLMHASPMIAPLKAGDNWIFRARLNGLSKDEAYEACQYLDGCMAIAPSVN